MASLRTRIVGAFLLVGFVHASPAAAQGLNVVGKLNTFKAAKVSSRPTSGGSYSEPTPNQPMHNGDGVRTERRGFAQISFNDKSALRLSELTELIVQDSITLRRLQLAKGSLWIRVTKGSNTSVQTPIATATVRGTEFLFDDKGNLAVREGIVDLEANGYTIQVGPGEVGGVGIDGKPFKKPIHISTDDQVNVEVDGIPDSWMAALKSGKRGADHNEFLALLILPFLFRSDGSSHDHSQVPEPATMTALLVGGGAILALRRPSRRA